MEALNSVTFTVFLLLSITLIIQQGKWGISGQLEECDLSKIEVTVHRTRTRVKGKREFLVVVSNVCWCPQSNITIYCNGFKSVEPVDPNVLVSLPGGGADTFLVNGGNPVVNGNPVYFKYAWPTRFRFSPLHSKINC